MKMLPDARPQITRAEVEQILKEHGVKDKVAVVGIRGYYKRTMGDPTKNDRGIYDDTLIVISPSGFMAFNGNVDPSAFRPGIAVLKPGVYRYRPGIHGLNRPKSQQYEAFVQAGPVTVIRDGGREETGMFGINQHRGGDGTTGSLGCQTIPPSQWASYRMLLKGELKRYKQADYPYVLVAA